MRAWFAKTWSASLLACFTVFLVDAHRSEIPNGTAFYALLSRISWLTFALSIPVTVASLMGSCWRTSPIDEMAFGLVLDNCFRGDAFCDQTCGLHFLRCDLGSAPK